MKLLLGSGSPRRKELLEALGLEFSVVKITCEEMYPPELEIPEIAGFLSELKSASYPHLGDDEVLLTADTLVVAGEEVLGKPRDKTQATEMLKKLSGTVHQVYTAVTLRSSEKQITKTDVARVEFSTLSEAEIMSYVDQFQPYDKAGSYGIQEWLGLAKARRIEGSYYTIMGLPTHLVYEILAEDFRARF